MVPFFFGALKNVFYDARGEDFFAEAGGLVLSLLLYTSAPFLRTYRSHEGLRTVDTSYYDPWNAMVVGVRVSRDHQNPESGIRLPTLCRPRPSIVLNPPFSAPIPTLMQQGG